MKQRIGENLLATKSGSTAYIPDRGDIVWLSFDPQAGHEQMKRRPAIIISPMVYNAAKFRLALVCPITHAIKGYPFEVLLPKGMQIKGAILSDQLKSLDWEAREADFIEKVPQLSLKPLLQEVSSKVKTLLP